MRKDLLFMKRKGIILVLLILFNMFSYHTIVNATPSINNTTSKILVENGLSDQEITDVFQIIDIIVIIKEDVEEQKKQPIIKYTEDEFHLLCRIIEAEARGESFEGKKAVGNVVINRVLHKSFPNTITDVIYAPRQFTPAMNGIIDTITPSEDSIKAANAVLYGETQPESEDAVYFWGCYIDKSSWMWTRTMTGQIGNHCFGK